MKDCVLLETINTFIIICSNTVVCAEEDFYSLTGFSNEEIVSRTVDYVICDMMKMKRDVLDQLKHEEAVSCILFTKDGLPKKIRMTRQAQGESEYKLVMTSESYINQTQELELLDQFFAERFMGAALYSMPDMLLLKANRSFVRYFDSEAADFNKYAGKHPSELGQYGAKMEILLRKVAISKTLFTIDEMAISAPYGEIYLNCVLVPLAVRGELKYILETTRDVTDRVRDRAAKESQEKEIRTQNKKLEAIIENISDQLIVIDKDGQYELLNKSARETFDPIFGLVRKLKKNSQARIYDDNNNPVLFSNLPITRVLQGEKFNKVRFQIKHTDTTVIEVNATPVFDEAGHVTCGIVCCRDITESVNKSEELQKQNRLMSAILENMHGALVLFDLNGNVIMSNMRARELFPHLSEGVKCGFSDSNYQFFNMDSVRIPVDELPAARALKGDYVQKEKIIEFKDGCRIVLEVTASPIYSTASDKVAILINYYDVTDIYDQQEIIRQKNLQLQDSIEMLRMQANMLDLSNDAIYMCVEDAVIVFWNKGAEQLYGYTKTEAIGKRGYELLKTKNPAPYSVLEILRDKGQWHGIAYQETKSGEKLVVDTKLKRLVDEDGKELVLHSIRDVTEKIHLENELKESEFSLKMAAKGAAMGTFFYDYSARKGHWTQTLKCLMGLENVADSEINHSSFMAAIYPEDRRRFLWAFMTSDDPVNGTSIDLTFRVARDNGTIRWLNIKGLAHFSEENIPLTVAGAVFDVTDKVISAEKIMKFSQKLQNILDNTDDLIISVDSEDRVSSINKAFTKYFLDNTGETIWLGMKIDEFKDNAYAVRIRELREQARSIGKFDVDIRSIKSNHVISYTVTPIMINHELVEIVFYGKDITERNKAEQEIVRKNSALVTVVKERTKELQSALRQVQDFSLAISHEMKTPLREIEYYAKFILEQRDVESNSRKILDICIGKLEMIDKISKYAMSVNAELNREKFNIKKMIQAVHDQLKTSMHLKQAKLGFDTGFPLIYADRNLIEQVITNIISNALKFSAKQDCPQLIAGCREEHKELVFYFKDNGVGFNPEYSGKLFNLFARLHSQDDFEGSGIGLAHIKNIIESHGGRCWIKGEENAGAVFSFTLPVGKEVRHV